ncbi:unnamed protein product [Medioppia subpectinata]|uniref:C2H2-type domain-containing protein n=1 Tax=Medioppia subpectinata TaxID=1979941 RepID=A0A7R9KMB4_9ACAR|nr:unnamed protein product [Medioppia subpectinata]CAG2104920.1 unnamed protein product [Medioppia subpectinata]
MDDNNQHVFESPVFRCGVTDCQMIFTSKQHLFQHLDQHMNDLHLGSDVKQEPEDNCVEPMDMEMQTLLNTTSKPSTSQSSQEMVNKDMNGKSSEDSMEMTSKQSMSEFLRQNKSEREKCFDRTFNAFICPINKFHKSFQKDQHFQQHLQRTHTTRQYICTHEGCGKGFNTADILKRHQVIHKDIKSFHCPHNGCQYKASCEEYLKLHLKRHSTGKVLRCDINGCDYHTFNNDYLLQHMKTKHNIIKSYKCHYNGCYYNCVTNKLLLTHLKTHSTVGIVEVNRCLVSDCQMTFLTKSELNVHRLTHGSGPAIECGIKGCNEIFYTFSQRLRHRVSVHNRRTYSYRRGKQWFEYKEKTETQEVMQTVDDNNEGVNEDMFDNNSKRVETRLIAGKPQSLALKCGVTDCQMTFASKEDLYKHLDKHMNDLELGSVVCEELENNCVEPMNTEMETLFNGTSKLSTSQSSQQLVVNKDMSGKSSEESNEQPMRATHEVMPRIYDTIKGLDGVSLFRYLHIFDPTIECGYEGCIDMFHTRNQLNKHWLKTHSLNTIVCKDQSLELGSVSKEEHEDNCVEPLKTKTTNMSELLPPNTSSISQSAEETVLPVMLDEDMSGNNVKQEPEDKCVEPKNTEMQTQVNNTSKPLTSQSSQEMVNKDMNGKSSEDSVEMPSKQLIFKSKQKCCLNDSKVLTKSETFIRHLNHKTEKQIHCLHNGCQYKSISNNDFIQHLKTHSADDCETPRRCQWPGCQYMGSQLNRHKLIHNKVRPHACHWPQCGKRFNTKSGLKLHTNIHNNIKPFACDLPDCGQRFVTKFQLNLHTNKHNNFRPIACDWPECGKRFTTKDLLKYHVNIHNNVKPYACDWPACEYRTAYQPSVWSHKIQTHKMYPTMHNGVANGTIQYPCDWPECGQQFTNKQTLKYHINVHQNVKPYACDWPECEYRSANPGSLYTHIKYVHKKHVHTGGGAHKNKKLFACLFPECGKRFASKPTLTDHMNVHNNVKPYACDWPECEFRTHYAPNVRLHKKHVHKI